MDLPHNLQNLSDTDKRASIAWRVRSGFYTSDQIVETVAEAVAEQSPDTTGRAARRAVRLIVAAEWADQQERQRSWPPSEPTVFDKLARAFDSLERNHKILARMNFACCQTCGVAEMLEERDEDTAGYVFFHEQDTQSVVGGGNLYLAFGSFTKSEKKSLDVGDIIVGSLRRAGLSVAWERHTGSRIMVRCGEWRRRFQENEDIEDVEDDDFDSDCMSSMSGGSSESESEMGPDTWSDLEIDEMQH